MKPTVFFFLCASLFACDSTQRRGGDGGGGNDDLAQAPGDMAYTPLPSSDGGFFNDDGGTPMTHDPVDCTEAMMLKSYIGCDYWPTVSGNAVWSVFDFAVVISNPGMNMANITVTGGGLSAAKTATVMPGQLVKIGLPWVSSLKGPDANGQGQSMAMTNSVYATGGAFHLTSDVPVLVYQFNALEYKAGTTGNDLNGKAWSTCPAAKGIACDSYSNDASLLLPSTAMTGNYVITGVPGDDLDEIVMKVPIGASYAVITATADATTVKIQLSKTADILATASGSSPAITAVAQNATTPAKVTYTMNAGDVIEIIPDQGGAYDLTGSIIEASAPVQVIVGNPCTTNPGQSLLTQYTCDHIEETVLPYETWGKNYVVTTPTGPNMNTPAHTVRIYGGATAANLTYQPSTPSGAPTSIGAGAVVAFMASSSFQVTGDQPFAVSSEQQSGEVVDTVNTKDPQGDPSLSFFAAVEQYRDHYIFLAPDDYNTSFADVVVPNGCTLMLDGAAVTTTPTPITSNVGVLRLPLSSGMGGSHSLVGTTPFGLQVIGYGDQTSYQYPGGLDLKVLGSAPPPIM
jgi:hypothetical protein